MDTTGEIEEDGIEKVLKNLLSSLSPRHPLSYLSSLSDSDVELEWKSMNMNSYGYLPCEWSSFLNFCKGHYTILYDEFFLITESEFGTVLIHEIEDRILKDYLYLLSDNSQKINHMKCKIFFEDVTITENLTTAVVKLLLDGNEIFFSDYSLKYTGTENLMRVIIVNHIYYGIEFLMELFESFESNNSMKICKILVFIRSNVLINENLISISSDLNGFNDTEELPRLFTIL